MESDEIRRLLELGHLQMEASALTRQHGPFLTPEEQRGGLSLLFGWWLESDGEESMSVIVNEPPEPDESTQCSHTMMEGYFCVSQLELTQCPSCLSWFCEKHGYHYCIEFRRMCFVRLA